MVDPAATLMYVLPAATVPTVLAVVESQTVGEIPVAPLSALVNITLTSGRVDDVVPATVIADSQDTRYMNAAVAGTTYRLVFDTLFVNPVVAMYATSEGIPPCTVAMLLYVVVLAP